MSASYRVEKPEVVREKFYPPFLQKDIENFKKQGAILEIKPFSYEDNVIKFYQRAMETENTLIHEINGIHRVKRGTKDKLVYTDTIHSIDKYGNDVEQFCMTYGTSRHPKLVPSKDRNGNPIMKPDGVRITHDIEFSPNEVDKIIELCDEQYRDQINYSYSEIPIDADIPYNLKAKYSIKSLEIFKTAPTKIIKKMIEQKKQGIENVSELEPQPFIIQKSSKP